MPFIKASHQINFSHEQPSFFIDIIVLSLAVHQQI